MLTMDIPMAKGASKMGKKEGEMMQKDSVEVKGNHGEMMKKDSVEVKGNHGEMIQKDSVEMKEKGMPEKGMGKPEKEMPSHSLENLPKAQAAKDATMAYFIMENWSEGKTMFHFNGSYHSNNHEGIVWHLKQQNKDLKIVTIALVLQDEITELEDENENIADFIFCVPESMTRTSR